MIVKGFFVYLLTKEFGMNDNRIMNQISTIFSIFMVFFYIGVGIYIIFYFERSYIDKPVRVMLGGTLIFYGIYRAFRTYAKIKEDFSRDKSED